MAFLEGKTPAERNKIIMAAALGVIALIALYLAFGRSFFGGSTAAKPNISPSPTPKVASTTRTDTVMPSQNEQDFAYQTTAVPAVFAPSAPDPGRNIFAFYEPPNCKNGACGPSPLPSPPPPKPEPTPTPPPIAIKYVNPQMVYAGSRGFRLEVNGEKIPPDAHIYFNQTQLPTTYINEQRVVTDIPANLVAQEGPRQIILQTPDGKKYSNQVMMTVQAPPTPQFMYVGGILRARGNNDTAIFERQGKPGNFGHRLNDVVDDRFRLVSISRSEVVLEDTQLGFRHRLPLVKGQPGAAGGQPGSGGPMTKGGFPEGTFVPYDPNVQKDIPGIPNNIPRYVPPPNSVQAVPMKKDVDDNDPND